MEIIDDDDDSDIPSKYVPIITAFKRSNNIICDACGSRGHHASKCYKRGLNFLPRDVQRHITAYNAKHANLLNMIHQLIHISHIEHSNRPIIVPIKKTTKSPMHRMSIHKIMFPRLVASIIISLLNVSKKSLILNLEHKQKLQSR